MYQMSLNGAHVQISLWTGEGGWNMLLGDVKKMMILSFKTPSRTTSPPCSFWLGRFVNWPNGLFCWYAVYQSYPWVKD
jgi:hypothetical protein